MPGSRNILIALVGLTPQVVTETLYALMVQRHVQVNEIFLITTAEGKEVIAGAHPKIRLPSLKSELERMYDIHKLHPSDFDLEKNVIVAKEETVELSDIRTDRDNILFPNLIAEFIREKTADQSSVLHCSIAGGRKTMSVAMGFALSLFGRKDDRLYHVLAGQEFEKSRKFFPETEDEKSQLALADVPYIRLREKLPFLNSYPKATFVELVNLAQDEISGLPNVPPLIMDKTSCTVRIGEKELHLRPFVFAVYLYYATRDKFEPGGISFSRRGLKDLWKIYRQIATAEGHRLRVAEQLIGKRKFDFAAMSKAISEINSKIRRLLDYSAEADFYTITIKGRYSKKTYGIQIERTKRKII